jgi:hypothetical protein
MRFTRNSIEYGIDFIWMRDFNTNWMARIETIHDQSSMYDASDKYIEGMKFWIRMIKTEHFDP